MTSLDTWKKKSSGHPGKSDPEPPRVVNIHMKNGVRPRFDIYIGREQNYPPRTVFPRSKWANPFTLRKHGVKALELYEVYVRNKPELIDSLHELEGKVLGCWCKPDKCHGDILVKLFNELHGGEK